MNILVINCGSSSLKFQLIDSTTESVKAIGLCERIGIDGQFVYEGEGKAKITAAKDMPTHTQAIGYVLEALTAADTGVITSLDEIQAVGHRIVHGGEKFKSSARVTPEMIVDVEACSDLAPLHNPANVIGIKACEELMPGVPMVAVFDTAFHQTMPKEAYMYGIPNEYYEKYGIRKYGFHGTSHLYVSKRICEFLEQKVEETKTIVCHLGNGSSICAVNGGQSVDTSMGLTPLEGLIMGTRSGDIDPTIIDFLMKKEGMSIDEVMNVLNKKSGVLGLSGNVSSDFRDLLSAADEGNELAATALDTFALKVAKVVGSYVASMNGVDNIVFTAGVGENSIPMREKICAHLTYLGFELDLEANGQRGKDIVISKPNSKVTVAVIPTNEELTIARDTVKILG